MIALSSVASWGTLGLMTATELRGRHERALRASVAIVAQVSERDLGRPTPCADWTLRDLLAHMTVQHEGFAAAARTIDVPFTLDPDLLDTALTIALAVPDGAERRAPGAAFAPGIRAADDGPVMDRIVAILGRSPTWPI